MSSSKPTRCTRLAEEEALVVALVVQVVHTIVEGCYLEGGGEAAETGRKVGHEAGGIDCWVACVAREEGLSGFVVGEGVDLGELTSGTVVLHPVEGVVRLLPST